MDWSVHPVTSERWDDLKRLFGARGACGGCWCMFWRRRRAEFNKGKGEDNRRALKKLVDSGDPPGLLGYDGEEPVAWCALAPREQYPVLARSRVLKPVDEHPVWSVTCFFVAKGYRRKGLAARLLDAAAEYAHSQGARIIEGYPVEPSSLKAPDVFLWTGIPSSFERAGFMEVARRSPARPIMRRKMGRQA